MHKFLTLKDVKLKGKYVLLRIDVNSPLKNGKIELNERIIWHAKTIKFLARKKARLCILAHQGRKDGKDYLESMQQHAKLLSKYSGIKIKYIHDLLSDKVKESIRKLKEGSAIMLKNVRSLDDENLIVNLEPLFDFFVLDGFSVAHRDQASVTGFKEIPNIAGPIMEREIRNLEKLKKPKKPYIILIGGAKPDDPLKLIEKTNASYYLCAGFIGELFLELLGYDLGKKTKDFIASYDYLIDEMKRVYEMKKEKIILPVDLAYIENGKRKEIMLNELPAKGLVLDIGRETIKLFKKYLSKAKTIYVKGPVGDFEVKNFEKGTKELFKFIARIDAFKVAGGGHTTTAIDKFKARKGFNHISLAGGAMIRFIIHEELPGIKALEESYKKFKRKIKNF